jgi:hypothetical protein
MPANNLSSKITPPPAKVQTAADSALAKYPELAIPGLEECSKVRISWSEGTSYAGSVVQYDGDGTL